MRARQRLAGSLIKRGKVAGSTMCCHRDESFEPGASAEVDKRRWGYEVNGKSKDAVL